MKTLSIDLRWIDSSGIGTYIQGMMPGLVHQMAGTAIVALGNPERLSACAWSHAPHVEVVACKAARYSMSEQWELPRTIPARTDLFFAPHYPIPLAYGGPLAVTVHDMSHLVVPEIAGNWKKRLYARTMFRSIRKRASVIFTVSEFSRSELVRLTTGSETTPIITTYLGIEKDWSRARELARECESPYIVYVGNVKPYKNVGRLVDAFLRISDRVPHRLIIVGQSAGLITGESDEFFRKVGRAADRVELAGVVSRTKLLSLVGHASALVLPSLYEGFGLPPLEAMAAGTPVVISRVASLPEICGEAAVYFEPLDVEDIAAKLGQVLTDPELAASMRQKGLERSSLFRWEACSTTTAEALKRVLQAKR